MGNFILHVCEVYVKQISVNQGVGVVVFILPLGFL